MKKGTTAALVAAARGSGSGHRRYGVRRPRHGRTRFGHRRDLPTGRRHDRRPGREGHRPDDDRRVRSPYEGTVLRGDPCGQPGPSAYPAPRTAAGSSSRSPIPARAYPMPTSPTSSSASTAPMRRAHATPVEAGSVSRSRVASSRTTAARCSPATATAGARSSASRSLRRTDGAPSHTDSPRPLSRPEPHRPPPSR